MTAAALDYQPQSIFLNRAMLAEAIRAKDHTEVVAVTILDQRRNAKLDGTVHAGEILAALSQVLPPRHALDVIEASGGNGVLAFGSHGLFL